MDTQEIEFELPKSTKLLTVEELEKALAEEQEIADQLIRNAEARKRAIKKQIAEVKAEQKRERLHKMTEILRNLHFEYGQDFVELAKKEIAKKIVKNPRGTPTEAEDFAKFEHLKNRGYTADDKHTYNQNGQKITASIPAQRGFDPYFTMNPNKYIKLWAKYNKKEN